jgi:hypothetical protein
MKIFSCNIPYVWGTVCINESDTSFIFDVKGSFLQFWIRNCVAVFFCENKRCFLLLHCSKYSFLLYRVIFSSSRLNFFLSFMFNSILIWYAVAIFLPTKAIAAYPVFHLSLFPTSKCDTHDFRLEVHLWSQLPCFLKSNLTSLLPAYLHVGKLHVSSVIISAIVKTFRLKKGSI